MATLQFTIKVDDLEDESLVVTSYQGQDNVSLVMNDDGIWCHGFRYHIELASRRPDITPVMVVDNNADRVVFSDNSQTITKLGQPIPYNALSGGVSDTQYINTFSKTTQFEVSEAITGDSNFKHPHYAFSQQHLGTDMDYQCQDSYIHYDTSGRYKGDNLGKVFNQHRIESLRRNAHAAQGTSDEPALCSGVKFDMQEHTEPSFNRDWLIIATTHQGKQSAALEEAAGSEPTTYANQFSAIPTDKIWCMPQITKPRVEGPMRAYVVGPTSEDIFCDEYGRVKLHFPWDRYSNGDEQHQLQTLSPSPQSEIPQSPYSLISTVFQAWA